MSTISVNYEVFEEDRPSYLPSYIMSGFVLVAVVSLAGRVPLWPLSLPHLCLALWFGVLFRWMLLNARERRVFISHQLFASPETYKHSFRYAVAEAAFFEMPVSEIEEVRVSTGEPRYIEVIGKSEGDVYFLPRSADTEQLIAVLKAGNPAIRVTT